MSSTCKEIKSGWMKKKGRSIIPSWRHRYFVLLENGEMSYYEDDQKKEIKGRLNLQTVSKVSRINNQTICLITKDRLWEFWAWTPLESSKWEQAIQSYIKKHEILNDNILLGSRLQSKTTTERQNKNTREILIKEDDDDDDNNNNYLNNIDTILNNNDNNNGNKIEFEIDVNNVINIQASNHQWLSCAEINGTYLLTTNDVCSMNERFYFNKLCEYKHIYSIQCAANKYYLSVHQNKVILTQEKNMFSRWIISCMNHNNIVIKSEFQHFYLSLNHHQHQNNNFLTLSPNISILCYFVLSPSIQITSNDHNNNNNNNNNHHNIVQDNKIYYPTLPCKISLQNEFNNLWLGVNYNDENSQSSSFKFMRNLGSFDDKPLDFQIFSIIFHVYNNRLILIKTFNNYYLSAGKNDNIIQFKEVKNESQYQNNLKNYFYIYWHDVSHISLTTYYNTIVYCNSNSLNNHLLHDLPSNSLNLNHTSAIFKISPRAQSIISKIPTLKLHSTIQLKTINRKFFTFRPQPDHYESSALIIGKWETIHVKLHQLGPVKCVISLITSNGKLFACNDDGSLRYITDNDDNNNDDHKWEVLFHTKNKISLKNVQYSKWIRNDQNGWLVCDVNDNFDMLFNNNAQFEVVPWAN